MRLVRRGFIVPLCAATHPHWYVQEWVSWAILVFAHRANLKRPIRDVNGHVVVRAMPEWYVRAESNEDTEALDKRRADFMQDRLAALLVMFAHMSFENKTVLPSPKAPDYMTLREWALHMPGVAERCKDPVDAIERAMRFLKRIGVFSFTKQWRQVLVDGPNAGKYRSTGGALRRVSTKWIDGLHGIAASALERLNKWLNEQREKKEKKERAAADAFTEEVQRRTEPLIVPPRAPAPESEPNPDRVFFDQVEHDHPEWIERNEWAKINAEVRRLRAEATRDTS